MNSDHNSLLEPTEGRDELSLTELAANTPLMSQKLKDALRHVNSVILHANKALEALDTGYLELWIPLAYRGDDCKAELFFTRNEKNKMNPLDRERYDFLGYTRFPTDNGSVWRLAVKPADGAARDLLGVHPVAKIAAVAKLGELFNALMFESASVLDRYAEEKPEIDEIDTQLLRAGKPS